MEFLIVRVKDQPNANTDVLINRQTNGKTGVLLTLGQPGWILVSANLPGAREQKVEVKNTTPLHPMNIEIQCAQTPGAAAP